MLVGVTNYPLGRRGERPLHLSMPYAHAQRLAASVPGAKATRHGLSFSYEALPVVRTLVSVPDASIPIVEGVDLMGLWEYETYFKSRLRGYQKEMVAFLATLRDEAAAPDGSARGAR